MKFNSFFCVIRTEEASGTMQWRALVAHVTRFSEKKPLSEKRKPVVKTTQTQLRKDAVAFFLLKPLCSV